MIDVQIIRMFILVFAYIFMTISLFRESLGLYSSGALGLICSFLIIYLYHS